MISNRLFQIREWMEKENFDAFIIPHDDEYLSEYLPPQNERLSWATGFTGSAGIAIILNKTAAIFVDGRYTVQVREQVDEQLFEYLHLIENPYLKWLHTQVGDGGKIAYDPRLHRASWYQSTVKQYAGKLNFSEIPENPIDTNWQDRPLPVSHPALLLGEEYTGRTSTDKREEIASVLQKKNVDSVIITQLDSISWLLNIRGQDVPCNPVLLCHAVLHNDSQVDLYIDPEKIPDGFTEHVGDGVSVYPSDQLKDGLNRLQGKSVLLDPNTSNVWIKSLLDDASVNLINGLNPCLLPKACKNSTEISGMKACHIRDGVAVTKYLAWLDDEIAEGNLHDEGTLSDKLEIFRRENEKFMGLSFTTISAAAGNAAMCHYNHMNQKEYGRLEMKNLYLVDSGGQYLDGTTDITRTVAVGEVSSEIKEAFTLVLKGHIALGSAIFPDGTSGMQLDPLARQFLWQRGYDYDHGTGHGVGAFLNVHEGPQSIGKKGTNIPLKPGMIVSNEPGYYRANEFGIRCENLVLVKDVETHGDLPTYGFENITFVPFDTRLIDVDLLTSSEREWVNDYHMEVGNKIGPLVNGSVSEWLKNATKSI